MKDMLIARQNIDTFKQTARMKDMLIARQNIMHYVVEPVRIYTNW